MDNITDTEPTPPGSPTWKDRASIFWRDYARPFVFVAIVLTAFRSSVADWNDVPTGSMRPTIMEGDRIFVNKLAYDLKVPYTTWRIASWSQPQRGDVVVFFAPHDGTRMVKRVVGLPGDTVEMRHEQLVINGQPIKYEPLDEDFINQIPEDERSAFTFASEGLGDARHPVAMLPGILDARRTFGPIEIPQGKYFLMGDNRDNSHDSRYYGPVEEGRIVGKALRVVVSLDRENYYLPRWSRAFRELP